MKKHEILHAFRELEKKYLIALREIENCYELLDQGDTTHPVDHNKQLRNAARLMANSELNKEDLSQDEIFNMLLKMSEDEVRKKIGFWAQPLPKDKPNSANKTYTSKPR